LKIYNGLMEEVYGFIKDFKPLPESVKRTESEEIINLDKDDDSPFITFKTITAEAEYSVTYFYLDNVLRVAILKDNTDGKAIAYMEEIVEAWVD
jgi:hypothetical protein